MQYATTNHLPRVPARPLRVLIEDPALVIDDLATPTAAIEVTVCSGPGDEQDVCPLVMDGTCPHEACDIVVSALEGVWAPSVRAAWAQKATPVVDATDLTASDPIERLRHHVGAAIQHLTAKYNATA